MGEIGSVLDRVGSARIGWAANLRAGSVATHGAKAGGSSAERAKPAQRPNAKPLQAGKATAREHYCLTRFGIRSPFAASDYHSLV